MRKDVFMAGGTSAWGKEEVCDIAEKKREALTCMDNENLKRLDHQRKTRDPRFRHVNKVSSGLPAESEFQCHQLIEAYKQCVALQMREQKRQNNTRLFAGTKKFKNEWE